MLFNSLQFLVFFPVVLLITYVLPKRVRYIWLLVASYFFYMCWNAVYALLILASTFVTYVSGLLIDDLEFSDLDDRACERRQKLVIAASFLINLGILFYFKYANAALDLLTALSSIVHIQFNVPQFDILLPVGISFYTFQALSYTMDVYRGDVEVETNFLRYALFVSFFPQLVAGPIERSSHLLGQLREPRSFDYDRARDGFMLMIWGFFLKLVLADRIAIFVDTVYGNYTTYQGLFVVVATVLFALQIYCDFAGYSTIAMGAAEILGVDLMENFDAPYLSTSVGDFWRRWHISLTSWFRDYLYIPLGGSRKGTFRTNLNKMIVFLVSGLWHGADLSFVVWGGLNGLYQVIGETFKPTRDLIVNALHIKRSNPLHQLLQGLITFVLIDFAWIFFRANTLPEAFSVISSMLYTFNPGILSDGTLFSCGLDAANFVLLLVAILVLLVADILKRRGVCVRHVIAAFPMPLRHVILVFSICFILVFGIWGSAYDAAGFIYFQF